MIRGVGQPRGRGATAWRPPVSLPRPTANRQPLTPVKGRAGHPWPAAAEQGRSALPNAPGRAVIAMTAVRRGTCQEPGKITDQFDIRPPTAATPSRPYPARRSREGTRGHGDKGARGR